MESPMTVPIDNWGQTQSPCLSFANIVSFSKAPVASRLKESSHPYVVLLLSSSPVYFRILLMLHLESCSATVPVATGKKLCVFALFQVDASRLFLSLMNVASISVFACSAVRTCKQTGQSGRRMHTLGLHVFHCKPVAYSPYVFS